ncbi:probable bifunctional dTTP/UTP pyrophosphatase/methyltransferase protein isoform X1 [Mytilus edulis]|uniref:probable bifunctional dTTP/UTP pyrophosphatase/methyltransferase protein isoform X1 n=1 Tax=Mytilus edulis TaxID=6550 RepID=UPI0039EFBC6E
MLQPIIHNLNCKRIILASSSPRRKQILENIGLKFEILKSNFEENLDKSSFKSPVDYVKETAKQKTIEVASILADKQAPIDLVIGADTVVTHNNVIFEKPRDKTHACEMLKQFSGSIHTVWTAVVLITPINSTVFKGDKLCAEDERFYITEFQESTDVMMTKLTPEIIKSYVDTGETLDKAGGYGIQAIGGSLIEGIKGDYFNVMGFPLHKFCCNVSRIFCHQASE